MSYLLRTRPPRSSLRIFWNYTFFGLWYDKWRLLVGLNRTRQTHKMVQNYYYINLVSRLKMHIPLKDQISIDWLIDCCRFRFRCCCCCCLLPCCHSTPLGLLMWLFWISDDPREHHTNSANDVARLYTLQGSDTDTEFMQLSLYYLEPARFLWID